MKNKFVSINKLSFSYEGEQDNILNDISFDVDKGDYLALLGPNGSGKSTLARLIAGFLIPTSGSIDFYKNPDEILGIVFQSPRDQIVALTVGRDTSFGPENLGLPKIQIDQRVTKVLTETNLIQKIDSSTYALSLGQTQKLALSGILALNPSLLILDESLSMIDPATRLDILNYLDELNKQGITIIHVTHDTDEARRAKKIIAIEKGSVFFQGTPDDILKNPQLELKLFGEPLMRLTSFFDDRLKNKEIVLKMQDVSFSYDNNEKSLFSNFSLELKKGTLNAIMGASGSGKSTLFEIASGLLSPSAGKIFAQSMPAFALQDCDSALFEEFAADDVAFAPLNNGFSPEKIKDCVKNAMDLCTLPFDEFADRKTMELSGGEKRKLSLACIIAMDKDILFFDEPTSALDPASRCSIMKTLRRLCDDGKTILFSTHRLDEGAYADRCITIEDGKIIYDTQEGEESIAQSNNLSDFIQIEPHPQTKVLDKLQKTKNGEYQDKRSIIHKINPVLKYLIFFTLFIAGLCVDSYKLLIGVNLICIIYSCLAKYPIKKLILRILKMIPWIMFFMVFQFIFFPAQNNETIFFKLGFFSITQTKISLAIKTLLHCIAAIISLSVFMFSTNETEIIDGIQKMLLPLKKIGFPSHYVAMVVGIIFRFIPILTQEASLIIKAQIVRGGLKDTKGIFNRIKNLLPLFVPLILQTIKRATNLGDTLTARQFK